MSSHFAANASDQSPQGNLIEARKPNRYDPLMRLLSHCRLLALSNLLLTFLLPFFIPAHASPPYALTIIVEGSGSVNRNPSFDAYPANSVVTLTANPAPNWVFSRWTGDLSGSENPINITMSAPRSVTAHFTALSNYTITTTTVGQGTIALNPPGGTYVAETTVTATATASNGWAFAGWSGDAAGTANPLSITVQSNQTITATFAELPVIEQAPQNVLTNSGSNVSFDVVARGASPLSYLWQFAGEPLPATGPTLTLTNVHDLNEGTYTVTVTNAYGSATASATLELSDSGCDGTNVVSSAREAELRAAIQLGGHVRLCFNGTVTLTQPIEITKDVSLDASDRTVAISGNNATRLFIVRTNTTLAATNLTLTQGRQIGENHTEGGRPGFGGAILIEGGRLLLARCTLSNNVALGGNGIGDAQTAIPGGPGSGGAIFNDHGILQISSSIISSNAAIGGNWSSEPVFDRAAPGTGQGGAIASIGGTVLLADVTVNRNQCRTGVGASTEAHASGGALYFDNAIATVTNCTLSSNAALGSAGWSIDPTTYSTHAFGGAIYSIRGQLRLEVCAIQSNSAISGDGMFNGASAFGGALYTQGPVAIISSTISSNLARAGFGRFGGPLAAAGAWYNAASGYASESLFHANTAQGGQGGNPGGSWTKAGTALGGGIQNNSNLALTNCTFALNVALSGVPDYVNYSGDSAGGALYVSSNSVTLAQNVTFASNVASNFLIDPSFGGGTTLGASIANSNGVITLRNTIIAYPNGTNSNVQGPITDAGHNISSDGSANFNSGTSFNFTDPRLTALADNGGPTWTMALLAESPAIDFGDPSGGPAIDQRGITRPQGTQVDIGAYEYLAGYPPRVEISATSNGGIRLSFRTLPEFQYRIQQALLIGNWSTVETISGSTGTITREFPATDAAQFFRVLAE